MVAWSRAACVTWWCGGAEPRVCHGSAACDLVARRGAARVPWWRGVEQRVCPGSMEQSAVHRSYRKQRKQACGFYQSLPQSQRHEFIFPVTTLAKAFRKYHYQIRLNSAGLLCMAWHPPIPNNVWILNASIRRRWTVAILIKYTSKHVNPELICLITVRDTGLSRYMNEMHSTIGLG